MKIMFALLLMTACSAFAQEAPEAIYGPFQSNIGEIEIRIIHESVSPKMLLEVVSKQPEIEKLPWKVIYKSLINRVEYVAPLMPDESSFVVVSDAGAGYETAILQLEAPASVAVQLDIVGRDFPEIIRSGTLDTRFVVIRNAGSRGNVLDVADIYAMQDGIYKREERVPYEQKLSAIESLSRKFDQAATELRKGVVVRP